MTDATNPLFDATQYGRWPGPLAEAAQLLDHETATSGEHTTADEVAGCIETAFSLLGRWWVAEYLAVGAPDPAINRLLHTRLVASGGRVLGGAWLGLARSIRAVFLQRGLLPVTRGLADVTFGELGEVDHPVARLSAYRNSFAHGSFQSVVSDIREHRQLLGTWLGAMNFLTDQPIVVDTGRGIVALRLGAEAAQLPHGVVLPPQQPCIVAADGRVVPLFPLLLATADKAGWRLDWPAKKGPGPQDIVRLTQFAVWFERYQAELQGDVEARLTCLGEPVAWPSAQAGLSGLLAKRHKGLVVVETAPGAPRSGLLAALAQLAPTLCWRVMPGELMGNGLILLQAVLRETERVLGLPRLTLTCRDPAQWRTCLQQAAQRLQQAGVVVRVAIDDLHRAEAGTRSEEPGVLDVWRALADGPFLAVAGAVRHWSTRPLPADEVLRLHWSASPPGPELAAFLTERAATPLHRRTLQILTQQAEPLDLFAICDELDAGAPTHRVFEPAVERALWDLAPVLLLGRSSRETGDGGRETTRTFALSDRALLSTAVEVTP